MNKPAARVGDMHLCPQIEAKGPHVGGPILPPCEPTVLINSLPAARAGDMAACVGGGADIIITGAATVYIGGLPAARMTDRTAHNGTIIAGSANVLIGGPVIVTGVTVAEEPDSDDQDTEEPVPDDQGDDLPPPQQPWPPNTTLWNQGYRQGYNDGFNSSRTHRIRRYILEGIPAASGDNTAMQRYTGWASGFTDGCRDREAGRPHVRERS